MPPRWCGSSVSKIATAPWRWSRTRFNGPGTASDRAELLLLLAPAALLLLRSRRGALLRLADRLLAGHSRGSAGRSGCPGCPASRAAAGDGVVDRVDGDREGRLGGAGGPVGCLELEGVRTVVVGGRRVGEAPARAEGEARGMLRSLAHGHRVGQRVAIDVGAAHGSR